MAQIFRSAISALPLLASALVPAANVSMAHAQTIETGQRKILQADSSWNGKAYKRYRRVGPN